MLQTLFEQNKYIEPVTIFGETAPIILMWPHNGTFVPQELHDQNGDPLGIDKNAFDPNSPEKRHEVADWGMKELLEILLQNGLAVQHVVSNVSRAVADNNRLAPFAIPTDSDDNITLPFPLNQNLSTEEQQKRLNKYHSPYQKAADEAIRASEEKFGTKPIIIDMHSFTRIFRGKRRDVCIGTFKPKVTQASTLVEAALKQNTPSNIQHAPNAPYNLLDTAPEMEKYRKRNAGQRFENYVGIEICNDLLETHQQRTIIATAIISSIKDVAHAINTEQKHENQSKTHISEIREIEGNNLNL